MLLLLGRTNSPDPLARLDTIDRISLLFDYRLHFATEERLRPFASSLRFQPQVIGLNNIRLVETERVQMRKVMTERRGEVQVSLIKDDEAKLQTLRQEKIRCEGDAVGGWGPSGARATLRAGGGHPVRGRRCGRVGPDSELEAKKGNSAAHARGIGARCVRCRLENPMMAYPTDAFLEGQRFTEFPKTVFPNQLCITLMPLIDLLAVCAPGLVSMINRPALTPGPISCPVPSPGPISLTSIRSPFFSRMPMRACVWRRASCCSG